MIQKASLIILAGVVIGGCGSGGGGAYVPKPVKAPEPINVASTDWTNLFPFKVGNQWTYEVQSLSIDNTGKQSRGAGEVIFNCTSATPSGDGTKATIEVMVNGTVNEKQIWMVNSKGLYQISVGTKNVPFVPIQPAILFPAEKGKSFTWEGTGMTPLSATGSAKVTTVIDGPQEVDTGMGAITAIGATSTTVSTVNGKKATTKSTTWWKPGVGVVRYHSAAPSASQTLILKSFTPK